MYRKATLRKMPEHTRRLARLLNELESVSKRLRHRVAEAQVLELYARASMRATAATKDEVKE